MINVCIVGVGLIGGSLGQALRRVRKKGRRLYSVSGLGRSPVKLEFAQRLGALDRFSTDPARVVPQADVVVLASPVQTMASLARKILPLMKTGAILTDAGSVKADVTKKIQHELSSNRGISFVGAHPLAGSEKFGVRYARPTLFRGAKVVITKDGASRKAHAVISSLWKDVGAAPIDLSGQKHDEIMAVTSHLPHLMAFALFNTVKRLSGIDKTFKSLTAGSFADMTRVAGSEPELWAGIVEMNRPNIRRAVQAFSRELNNLLAKKGKALQTRLSRISRAKHDW